MRVLFYITHFFPRPTGATYSAVRLAAALRTKDVGVSFVVDERGQGWGEDGSYEGFEVRSFTLCQPGKLRKLRGLVGFTKYILSKRRTFDIFHIHGGDYVTLFLCWWVKTLTRRKVMLKITSDGWDTPKGVASSKYGSLASMFYRRLDGVVAMTSGQAEKSKSWGFRNRLATIPNGVDCQEFCPVDSFTKTKLRRKLEIPSNVPVLNFVGWLGYGKGTDVLFRVWRQLRMQFPEVHLLLAGDYLGMAGSREKIGEFLAQHELSPALADSSQLITATRSEDVKECLQASDILLFPSRKEGFGTVQVEAMSCGLPCVVNDLPGVSCDIFPDESVGYRIRNNDIAAYVEVCSNLLHNKALRESVGRAARERAIATYSLDIVADRYVAFYNSLLGAPS